MIECVPNVSEGCDPAVIEQIANAITGCHVLDIHSDCDHHRSVLTMVGDEKQIAEGAVALVERATALLDFGVHHGVHPRIGAVDVMPFIPLGTTVMADCIGLAERVGRVIADRFNLPVFLYGEAARRPDRVSLPTIRRGGLAGLAEKLRAEGADFGPRRLHPTAGAVAIGARELLVAFNVVLDSADVHIARKIAASLRETNGGLPGVKALGLPLASRNLAQVSMNLTQVAETTIPEAFQAVQREATERGVDVLESEIVGLVPQASLAGASAADLLLRVDPRHLILETQIADHSR